MFEGISNQTKTCGTCKESKPVSDFYLIKASDEISTRFEKNCKRCKKTTRNRKISSPPRKTCQSAPLDFQNQPSTHNIELRNNETECIAKGILFDAEERFLGRELSQAERIDSVQHLNELVFLLLEEYGKMKGGKFYVKT